MNSEEFLAKIRMVLEGKQKTISGLQQVKKTTEQMSQKQVVFPWLKNVPKQAAMARSAVLNFSKELQGFTKIGTKQNTIWKEGIGAGSKLTTTYKNQAGVVKEVSSVVDKNGKITSQSLRSISTSAKQGSGAMAQLGLAMRRALIVAPVWLLLRSAMMGVFNLVRDNIKFLVDLETAMARIKIVGRGTVEEFEKLKNTIVTLSKVYGVSGKDAIEAAKIFAQQGKTVNEVIHLTQQAMLASKVLGKDVTTVVEDLTAATKGFNIPALESISIIDKWIAVEKNFAVTSKDLADATKKAGATAHTLGITLSEYLGDVTAVIEVTRKTGKEAARGLSFIYARMFTTAKQTIQQVAKVKIYLDEQKKATNELTGVLRPASDVLGEIADKWSNLTKEQKLQIASALGSKRQMVVVNALMQNYTRSIDARIKAITSAGESDKAFGIIQDTMSFKLKQVTSGWNALTNALLNTSGFKSATDALNNFLVHLTYLVDAEKGYRLAISGVITQQKLLAESEISAASNLKEVIDLRDKLLSRPPTDKITERIKTLDNFIKSITKNEPTLKLAIETGNSSEIDDAIEEIQKKALRKSVILDVQLEYLPLIEEAQKLADSISSKVTGSKAILEQEVLRLYKKQKKEIEKQYKIALADFEIKKGIADLTEEENEARKELTEKEKEGLEIASKIAIFNIQNKANREAQLKYEIDLVKNSQTQYDLHDKTLKIQQLQNSLIEEQAKFRRKEKESVIDIFLQTAKLKGLSETRAALLEASLTKTILGEDALQKNIKLRLKLEEAITKEKLNQIDVSDKTLKLYNIAQREGIDITKELSKFLSGEIGFNQLREMPRVFDVFKREFADMFEKFQAAEFFGIPLKRGGKLSGDRIFGRAGSYIPISEFEATKGINLKDQKINAPVSISGLNINVSTELAGKTKDEVISNLKYDIADSIKNDPEIDRILKDKIELF